MNRHELIKDSKQSKNFRQIVLESSQAAQQRIQDFKSSQEHAAKERNRITLDLATKINEEETKTKYLVQKLSVKGVADMILENLSKN